MEHSIPTIYSRLEQHAEPVLQNYKTDLTEHDRLECRSLKAGQGGIWGVRENGTHFVVFPLLYGLSPVVLAELLKKSRITLEHIKEIMRLHPKARWYNFTCETNQRGKVRLTTAEHALSRLNASLASIQARLAEVTNAQPHSQ
ncbi:hypothetical protein PsAD2_03008 [Pseudovibrio axinellae]|uniref:Uncharacterized protein n=1 Tax=Pseudovibrio axinellae TaxID=989403 RepID=A0A165XG36_9HYPH|nr:hypothetical protein [Pseudovibrio axinellae]KZL17672.1 hypothetical protein PsAD2_03008 [Pseudovibrio axinellae]SER44187.1 hypothetical protein SAMN05421798_11074 [Pseudovibrio axinellae]